MGWGVCGGGGSTGRGSTLTPPPCFGAERREGGSPVPPPPRSAVQTATLCDLLASTAVRLCPGHPGVRMAFAPVASALHSVSAAEVWGNRGGGRGGRGGSWGDIRCAPPPHQDNRLTAILDGIIARVVERKIQERHGGTPRPPSPPPGTPTSHRLLNPGGLLWLQDPPHATGYALFQQHWRQGQVRPLPTSPPPHNARPPVAKRTH